MMLPRAQGRDLDRLAELFGLDRQINETDEELRARARAWTEMSNHFREAVNLLRTAGWTCIPPQGTPSLEKMIQEANEAQTALELAEKLLAMRTSPHGSRATLRDVKAFLRSK